jgi:hypothetical protein
MLSHCPRLRDDVAGAQRALMAAQQRAVDAAAAVGKVADMERQASGALGGYVNNKVAWICSNTGIEVADRSGRRAGLLLGHAWQLGRVIMRSLNLPCLPSFSASPA